MCNHVYGAIFYNKKGDRLRVCVLCKKEIYADGSFAKEPIHGVMEVYSRAPFNGLTYEEIRKLLAISKDDLLLNSWYDNRIYVMRRAIVVQEDDIDFEYHHTPCSD